MVIHMNSPRQQKALDLSRPAEVVAPELLGSILVREINGHRLAGRIVETEAYHQRDAASHSYRGQTPRTEVMFGPPGHLYVYFTYGMHHCCNVVTGPPGEGSAVLIRALEPVEGMEIMKQHRRQDNMHNLCNGPAKLCQALLIDKSFNGQDLAKPPCWLEYNKPLPRSEIIATTRIGISQDTHRQWRFYIKSNLYVSKL